MNSTPFFSIIIPVYNADKYLKECIDSILCQNNQNFEVILIDDGSTDNSGNICDKYINLSNNINVIHQINHGVSYARSVGLKRAKGEYVFFIDADDFILDNCLEELYKYIKKNNCDVLVFNYIDEKKKIHKASYIQPDLSYSGPNNKKMLKILCTGDYLNSLCRKVFRRTLINVDKDLLGIESVFTGEDLLITIPMFLHARSIMYYDKVFYCYRANETSITHSNNSKRYENDKIVHKRAYQLLCNQFSEASHLLRMRFLRTTLDTVARIIYLDNERSYSELDKISCDDYWKEFYLKEKNKLSLKDKIICYMLYHHCIRLLGCIGNIYFKVRK